MIEPVTFRLTAECSNQLSYGRWLIKNNNKNTLPTGIEPVTFRLTAERSNQLSYGRWTNIDFIYY